MNLTFPYPGIPPLVLPDSARISLLEPRKIPASPLTETEIIQNSLRNPINRPILRDALNGKKNAIIVVDDYSRNTPVHLILPEVLREMTATGLKKENIRLLVASGTHRPMTDTEKIKKLGADVVKDYAVLDHLYNHLDALIRLPNTARGTEVWVNRAVVEADFVLGIGHIVPHRVAGFSGGCKIIQPGACGAITTGQTHWLSAKYDGAEIMGKVDNPARQEIEAVALAAGLKYILNVILDAKGKVAECVCGDPIEAFRAGAKKSLEIFGVPLQEPADIVIAESYPADTNLWQAVKGIFSADLALKKGGVLILVTPCPEGVSAEHPQITEIGYRSFAEIDALVQKGIMNDLTLAAHLVHGGRVIREKGSGILVSPGIGPKTAAKIGFGWAATPQDAFEIALRQKGKNATIAILKNGGELMPILSGGMK